jgi:hypothetical protein
MERLPTHYKGKLIVDRIPYSMRGELIVAVNTNGNQFPESTFMHNVDKPFECHRMIPDLTMFTDATPPVQITPSLHTNVLEFAHNLMRGIRLTIQDTARNELLTKNPTLMNQLIKKDTCAWEWESPYYLEKSTNFLTTVDNIIPAAFATGTVGGTAGIASVSCASIRVELCFQGYLIVTEGRVPA